MSLLVDVYPLGWADKRQIESAVTAVLALEPNFDLQLPAGTEMEKFEGHMYLTGTSTDKLRRWLGSNWKRFPNNAKLLFYYRYFNTGALGLVKVLRCLRKIEIEGLSASIDVADTKLVDLSYAVSDALVKAGLPVIGSLVAEQIEDAADGDEDDDSEEE